MDEDRIRDALLRHWQFEGIDYDKSHEIYHEDAVLEFPQSGERFVGRQNFLTWRKQYPAKLDFRIRKITHDGDLWVHRSGSVRGRWPGTDLSRTSTSFQQSGACHWRSSHRLRSRRCSMPRQPPAQSLRPSATSTRFCGGR
jgi:hypothetical protein